MRFSFVELLHYVDQFGRPINVNYKGSEAYTTKLGGLLSFSVVVLTIVLAFQSIIEIHEM